MDTTTMGSGGQADRSDVNIAKGVIDRPSRCGSVGTMDIYQPQRRD